MLDFDDMLVQVGEFGLYQKALFIFQAPFCIFVTFVLFGQLFMTLYPLNIWCAGHYNCTQPYPNQSMTPFQRQNFSFPGIPGGMHNPCFIHNIDASFVINAVNVINRGNCGGRPCNYTHGEDNPSGIAPSAIVRPENYYNDGYRGGPQEKGYGNYGNAYQTTQRYSRPITTQRARYPTPSSTPIFFDEWQTLTPTSTTERSPTTPTTSSSSRNPISSGAFSSFPPSAFFSDNKSCPARHDVTISNRTFIFLPIYNISNPPLQKTPTYLPVEECNKVEYDPIQSGVPYPTITTEGEWWCRAAEYNTAATAVFFLGAIVGGFIIGYIADNYGRVPALVLANLLGALGGALSVTSTNIWLFMFFRFITGMAFDNCFTMMYILVLEFCGPSYRTLVANLSIAVFYTLGTLILPISALLIADWRIYGLVISLPMLLALLAIFFVPESARWLLSKGRAKEATDILRSFAKVNKKNVADSVFQEFEADAEKLYEEMQQEDYQEQSFTAALKTPRLRKTFILLVLIWSIIALVYDGHSRNILNLADQEWNVFWMFGLASLTEFPADMMLIFTLDRFGRRWLSFGSLTLSGAASIIAATIPPQMRTIGLVMAIISRFFVNVAFNIGLQFAAELLPTVIRAQGVNAIHIMGYVASIISPFVAAIGRTNPALSLIILGTFSIIGGCLSLFLAETLGEDLPNNLEEAEAFGITQSFWNCPICAKPKDEEEHGVEDSPINPEVTRRNNMRSTMRGETYRSSIISANSSRASRRRFPNIALNPSPATETTKLRRITH